MDSAQCQKKLQNLAQRLKESQQQKSLLISQLANLKQLQQQFKAFKLRQEKEAQNSKEQIDILRRNATDLQFQLSRSCEALQKLQSKNLQLKKNIATLKQNEKKAKLVLSDQREKSKLQSQLLLSQQKLLRQTGIFRSQQERSQKIIASISKSNAQLQHQLTSSNNNVLILNKQLAVLSKKCQKLRVQKKTVQQKLLSFQHQAQGLSDHIKKKQAEMKKIILQNQNLRNQIHEQGIIQIKLRGELTRFETQVTALKSLEQNFMKVQQLYRTEQEVNKQQHCLIVNKLQNYRRANAELQQKLNTAQLKVNMLMAERQVHQQQRNQLTQKLLAASNKIYTLQQNLKLRNQEEQIRKCQVDNQISKIMQGASFEVDLLTHEKESFKLQNTELRQKVKKLELFSKNYKLQLQAQLCKCRQACNNQFLSLRLDRDRAMSIRVQSSHQLLQQRKSNTLLRQQIQQIRAQKEVFKQKIYANDFAKENETLKKQLQRLKRQYQKAIIAFQQEKHRIQNSCLFGKIKRVRNIDNQSFANENKMLKRQFQCLKNATSWRTSCNMRIQDEDQWRSQDSMTQYRYQSKDPKRFSQKQLKQQLQSLKFSMQLKMQQLFDELRLQNDKLREENGKLLLACKQ